MPYEKAEAKGAIARRLGGYTTAQAARLMMCSISCVTHNLVRRPELRPAGRIDGKSLLWRKEDIIRFLEGTTYRKVSELEWRKMLIVYEKERTCEFPQS
jgi:hypothetical protein